VGRIEGEVENFGGGGHGVLDPPVTSARAS
jgi:hypothetical protein